MRWIIAGIAFVVTLLGALVATAPARVMFDMAASPIGLDAGRIQGTVWNAHILRLHVQGLVFAQAHARLSPGSVLTGSPRFSFALEDPRAQLRGRARAVSGAVELTGLSGVMHLGLFPGLSESFPPSEGVVRIDNADIVFDARGGCESARGHAATPVLADLGIRYGADLPVLDLSLSCAAPSLVLTLSGQSAVLALTGDIVMAPGDPIWRLQARPIDDTLAETLTLLGFEEGENGVYVLRSEEV